MFSSQWDLAWSGSGSQTTDSSSRRSVTPRRRGAANPPPIVLDPVTEPVKKPVSTLNLENRIISYLNSSISQMSADVRAEIEWMLVQEDPVVEVIDLCRKDFVRSLRRLIQFDIQPVQFQLDLSLLDPFQISRNPIRSPNPRASRPDFIHDTQSVSGITQSLRVLVSGMRSGYRLHSPDYPIFKRRSHELANLYRRNLALTLALESITSTKTFLSNELARHRALRTHLTAEQTRRYHSLQASVDRVDRYAANLESVHQEFSIPPISSALSDCYSAVGRLITRSLELSACSSLD
jgi:hypothetical protein